MVRQAPDGGKSAQRTYDNSPARSAGKRKGMAVGGVDDHAHILLSLPATVPISKAMQLIKAGSSKWMREEVSLQFQWQEAYAAFSIGISHVEETIHYINNQSAHHNKGLDFERELAMILAKHGIEPLQE